MRRRPHERDAATDPESSERDVRFGPDTVFRMRGSFRGPPGDSGPRARPTTALSTLQSNREASPARTGRGSGKADTARLTYPCQSSCMLLSCLTFGFMHKESLDEGAMWPTAFAVKELTAAEEAKI